MGKPNVADKARFQQRMDDIFERRWFTNNGPYVQEFEEKIAELTGIRHCIAMCNGTVALEITIRALGLTGEVIVPAMTFVATAHALTWQEIKPVFCDIDPLTHNIDPAKIEQLITPETSAILPVHLWGRPCATEDIEEIARRYNLKVLYDAAHAFAATHQGRYIGNFGSAEIFSFHATKFLQTFEGGAVITNDDELAGKIRLMKNFGFAGYDKVIYIGMNGKMSEISAAMGLTELEHIDQYIAANRDNYQTYCQLLANVPGLQLVEYADEERANYQYLVAELDEKQFGLSRDITVDILHQENIIARRYFYPGCHRMEPYRSTDDPDQLQLANTDELVGKIMTLPSGASLEPGSIARVCALLGFIAENAEKIASKLQQQNYSSKQD